MIPRLKPTLGIKEIAAAFRLPRKDDVFRFEKKFANLMDQKYALAFPYGRTGLMLLLKALGIKDKEIICPAYTCVVVPHAIVYSGNTPVFVDCEPEGFNMDLEKAGDIITDKTGALIATSVFGYPVNLNTLDKIRKKYPQVHIIQDCAHSFAAEWQGRAIQKEGVASFFGLNISKILTSIFGGMVTTDHDEFYMKLKALRRTDLKKSDWKKGLRRLVYLLSTYPTFWEPVYGFINQLERFGLLDHFVKYYNEKLIDMPKDYLVGMSNLEARVGHANLRRYHANIERRRAAADYYFANISHVSKSKNLENNSLNGLTLPPQLSGATYSHFAVKVKNKQGWLRRGIHQGIQCGELIEYSVPELKAYGHHPPQAHPRAAEYARKIINLPVWGGKPVAEMVIKLFK